MADNFRNTNIRTIPSASNRMRTSSDGQKNRNQASYSGKKSQQGRIQTRSMPQQRSGGASQGQGRIQPRQMTRGENRSQAPSQSVGMRTAIQSRNSAVIQDGGMRTAHGSAAAVSRNTGGRGAQNSGAAQAGSAGFRSRQNQRTVQAKANRAAQAQKAARAQKAEDRARREAEEQSRRAAQAQRAAQQQSYRAAQAQKAVDRGRQQRAGAASSQSRNRSVPLRNEYAPDGSLRNQAYSNSRDNDREAPARSGKVRYFYDYSLLFAIIFIFALGLLIIYSSSQYMASLEKQGNSGYYFMKQLTIGGAGLIGAIIMSFLDYRWLKNLFNGACVKIAYLASIGLLLFTLVGGLASHGKSRWVVIMGVNFQPAEVAKVGLILALALFISKYGPATKEPKNLIRAIVLGLVPTILIVTQNISSAVIVALIAAVMIFVAVDDVKSFVVLGTMALAGFFSAKPLVRKYIEVTGTVTRPEKYYMRRIFGWAAPEIFPDDAYQTQQSLYAIGSGGMTGHGLGESIQKFGKIPEVQNDMIFAILCEEFGFIGAATLIVLFIYIIYRIYQIAINASDLFGTMICTGVMAHLGAQVVLNIAVVTNVIPNTGVTLPFISYGGSAILLTMAEVGLVLSVAHKIELGER